MKGIESEGKRSGEKCEGPETKFDKFTMLEISPKNLTRLPKQKY